jgi:excinuclease UvrABC helicase subunit UvrB
VGELTFLRRWKDEILTKIKPDASGMETITESALAASAVDRAAEIRAQIDSAVAEERYEDAARLRDELKSLDSGL